MVDGRCSVRMVTTAGATRSTIGAYDVTDPAAIAGEGACTVATCGGGAVAVTSAVRQAPTPTSAHSGRGKSTGEIARSAPLASGCAVLI